MSDTSSKLIFYWTGTRDQFMELEPPQVFPEDTATITITVTEEGGVYSILVEGRRDAGD